MINRFGPESENRLFRGDSKNRKDITTQEMNEIKRPQIIEEIKENHLSNRAAKSPKIN